jgi:LPS export ABC transporter protein LptC
MLTGLGMGLVKFLHLKKDPAGVLALLPENSDITLNHIHQVATRDGMNEWTLDAESVRYQQPENKSIFKNVSVVFFLENGETAHLTGSDGVLLTDTKDMEIAGNVVARTGAHELKTDKLCYNHKSRSISTDTPIVVTGDGIHLTGKSMVFSFETEQAMVSGDVEAVFENFSL